MPTTAAAPIAPAIKPSKIRHPHRLMVFAILVLALSQCLPFGYGYSNLRERRNSDYDAVSGVDHDRYSAHPYMEIDSSGPDFGFTDHPLAAFVLVAFAVVFFSKLYLRPTWNKKVYWIAFLCALPCSDVPPDFTTWGGRVSAIALAMIFWAAFINMEEVPKKV